MGKFGDYPDEWDKSDNGKFGGARYVKEAVRHKQRDMRPSWEAVPTSSANTAQHIPAPIPTDIERICADVRKRIRDITAEVREQMINTDGATGQAAKKQRGGFPFLTLEHLSTTPEPAKIIGVKVDTEGRFGSRVIVKLSFKRETFLWTLTIKNNPNVKALTDKLGNDENNWVGQTIYIAAEQDEFSGNMYPRVSFPEVASKKR